MRLSTLTLLALGIFSPAMPADYATAFVGDYTGLLTSPDGCGSVRCNLNIVTAFEVTRSWRTNRLAFTTELQGPNTWSCTENSLQVVTTSVTTFRVAGKAACSVANDDGETSMTFISGQGILSEDRMKLRVVEMWDPLESTCRHASLSIL